MWNTLPSCIRREIITYNPSLRTLHKQSMTKTHALIRSIRRDRQCLGCVRHAMFVKKNIGHTGIIRKPSTRLYATIGMKKTRARLYSLCDSHKEQPIMGYGESERILFPRNVHTNEDISDYIVSTFPRIVSVIAHQGFDEDSLDLRRSENITMEQRVRPRWRQYIL